MTWATLINEVTPVLLGFDDTAADVPRAPGKWSAKELIGHLIDSAANNHQRLVRGQFSLELGIVDYEQDDWVRVQAYSGESWRDLVLLWQGYNRHLAHVVEVMPAEVRYRVWERSPWWQVAPEGTVCTLDFLISRYDIHLRHHLNQVYDALGVGDRGSLGG